MRVARYTDADAFAEGRRWRSSREPEFRARRAEIEPIVAPVEPERGRETAWSAREIGELRGLAPALHPRDPLERFGGAQQDGRPRPFTLARHVQTMPRTIDEVDVGVAASQKHRAVALGRTAISMRRRVDLRQICFGLDDASDNPPARLVAHQNLSEQEARQRDRFGGQFGAPQTPESRLRR